MTTVLVAGATGAVGQRLLPLLLDAGYVVHGSTRRPEKAEWLARLGVQPCLLDAFDRDAVFDGLARVRPDVVVHQLTDLAPLADASDREPVLRGNARLRREGTANLVDAALAAGCRCMVAQSIAWAYADGPQPCEETQPLDTGAIGLRAITVGGVVALESAVLGRAGLQGAVLRYGQFYGPGTGTAVAGAPVSLHVDAAAHAALRAVQCGAEGLFNVCEPNDRVSARKAERELGWSHRFRLADRGTPGAAAMPSAV